jgi:hypothetical protein
MSSSITIERHDGAFAGLTLSFPTHSKPEAYFERREDRETTKKAKTALTGFMFGEGDIAIPP